VEKTVSVCPYTSKNNGRLSRTNFAVKKSLREVARLFRNVSMVNFLEVSPFDVVVVVIMGFGPWAAGPLLLPHIGSSPNP
jgi:hypothetical protein